MSEKTDLLRLYSEQILALTTQMPDCPRLSAPTRTVRRRSPLCGSSVTVDVVIEKGVVQAYGHDIKACALGQAAASVVAQNILGQTHDTLHKARDQDRRIRLVYSRK